MQKRLPFIFWLLLAATLAVDAAVIAWAGSAYGLRSLDRSMAFHALSLGQLSVACIAAALVLKWAKGQWLVQLVTALLAAIVSLKFAPMPAADRTLEIFESFFGYYALHALLLCAALWLLQRTRFWARQTGLVHSWQYSLLQVLAIITATALLLPMVRSNQFVSSEIWVNIVFTASFVALAVGGVAVWLLPWNSILRLAIYFGLALLLAILCSIILLGVNDSQFRVFAWTYYEFLAGYYLIQAIIISLWLGCGQLLPISNTAAADERT
jgi:hypothetical protein